MGDGTVVHFSGEPLHGLEARVCRVPIEDFLGREKARVVKYPRELRSPDDVVKVALDYVAKEDRGECEDYHLWRNNCEHFACYCKTGRRRSSQVRRALGAAVGVAAAAVGAIGMGVARRKRRKGAGTDSA